MCSKDIDGEGGNGQITLKEFVEGMDEIECHKFDGPGSADSKSHCAGNSQRFPDMFADFFVNKPMILYVFVEKRFLPFAPARLHCAFGMTHAACCARCADAP